MESGSSPGQQNHGAYRLVVQSGAQAGTAFPLRSGTNAVGRSSANQIVLADRTVSARHALIQVGPEGVWVQDLDSTNGTFTAGTLITGTAWLRPGDTLQIGSAVLLQLQVADAGGAYPPHPHSGARRPAVAYSLVVQSGAQAGQAFALKPGQQTAGRAPGNQIVMTDWTVSARHALIQVGPEGVWVQDLGSKNGTSVNGTRVSASTPLRPGDTLQLGSAVLLALDPGTGGAARASQRRPATIAILVPLGIGAVAVVVALAFFLFARQPATTPGLTSPSDGMHLPSVVPAGQLTAAPQVTQVAESLDRPASPPVSGDSRAPSATPVLTPPVQPKPLEQRDASLPQGASDSPVPGQNASPGSQPPQPAGAAVRVAQPVAGEVVIPEWVPVAKGPPLPDEILESLDPQQLPPPGQPGFDPNESPFAVEHDGYVMFLCCGLGKAVKVLDKIGDGVAAVAEETLELGVEAAELTKEGGQWVYRESAEATTGITSAGAGAAMDLGDWAWDQVAGAGDLAWDGVDSYVLDPTVDAGEWLGGKAVDGGLWVARGTGYVLIRTKDLGEYVVVQTAEGAKHGWNRFYDGVQWVSLRRDMEKACGGDGRKGPGAGKDGTESPEFFFNPGAYEGALQPRDRDKLRLARQWMPKIILSKEEKCGEILRVVAKVMPYRDNQYVEDLAKADSVEIAYTLFYAWDGGRNYIEAHAGDNEGFVIGLVPSSRTEGRCGLSGLNYEFYGGRTVKHKDVPVEDWHTLAAIGALHYPALIPAAILDLLGVDWGHIGEEALEWFGIERGIEDWTYHEQGTRCPSADDPDYVLWVAESKHATYFDRDECEQTLVGLKIEVPDVWGLDRLVLGTLGFAEKLTPLDDILGISAGEHSIIVGGLEECEAGRDPVGLADRVEVWPISMQSIVQNDKDDCEHPSGSGSYVCMDGEDEKDRGIHWDSYDAAAPGAPHDMGDAYHVPFLSCPGFDTERAIAIRFDDVPGGSEWTVTALGLNGFDPRVGVSGSPFVCDDDTLDASSYTIQHLPAHGDIPPSDSSAQIVFKAVSGGSRTFYVDSADGRDGRFLVIIESPNGGLTITPGDEEDMFVVSPVLETELGFYVVSEQTDPDLVLSYPPKPSIDSSSAGMADLAISTGQGGYQGHATDEYLRLDLRGGAGEREFVVGSVGSGTGRYVALVYAETAPGTRPTVTLTGTSSPTPTETQTSTPTSTQTETPTPTPTATYTPTPRPNAPQIEYLRAQPASISAGECASLEWGAVRNATAARIDPGVGSVATPGSARVCPASATTYVMTAEGPGGTTTASVTITVSTAAPPQIAYFRAQPPSIASGGCTTLEWGAVSGATEARIEPDVGGVPTPGSARVCPATTTNYVLTATGPGGTTTASVTVAVTVSGLPQIEFFRANPDSIPSGECTTLEWGAVSNATEARIEPGVGGVGTPGSTTVCPADATTYVLTAAGPGGTATASVAVAVGAAVPVPPGNVGADRSGDFLEVVDIYWDPSPGATHYVFRSSICTESEVRIEVRQEVAGTSIRATDWFMEGCTAEDSYGWIQACNVAGCSLQVEVPWPGIPVSIEF